MPKSKAHYPEIEDIKQDLDSLKTNVIELTKHIKKDGETQTREIAETAMDRVESLQDMSKEQLKNVESHVKSNPARSIGMAFAAGLVASLIFKR